MREHASRVAKQILQKALTLTAASVLAFSSLAMAAPSLFSGSAFALGGNTLYVDASGADTGNCQTSSSPCQTITYAIGQASAGDTIDLESNISISSAVNINKSLTLDGNGYTLSPTFLNSGSSNNASIIVLSSNVTIQNLTIDGNSGTSLHGINVYEASGVTLNSVNVLNNDHAALVVNGSTVAATNFNTSGNGWGAVNVDPGSGVTTPSVFTLNSGVLSDTHQIWSDGSHVGGSATVTVNASGYNMYKVGGTAAWYFWTNQPLENFATITKNGVTTAYTTIQAAVDDSASSDTINVAPGTYAESVTVNHPLIIDGSQVGVAAADTSTGTPRSGSESTVKKFYITSSGVTIDGFSLSNTSNDGQVQVLAPGSSVLDSIKIKNNIFSNYSNVALPTNAAGDIDIEGNYFTAPATNSEAMQIKTLGIGGDCTGTQVLNNVFNEATSNWAADINISCTGSNSSNVTISGNKSTNPDNPNGPNMVAFSGVVGGIKVTNNVATTSGSQVLFFGSVSGTALITGNNFSDGGGYAISIHGGDNYIGVNDSVNTGTFTINNNSFVNNYSGIHVASGAVSGTIDATLNYWGTTPDFSSLVSLGVNTTPYFTNADRTIRSDAKVVPDSNGNATANSTTPQVVVKNTSQPVTVTVTPGTNNASVDYSALIVSSNTATVPQTTITAPAATVSIPASTTVTASGGTWDGIITAPTTTTVSLGSGKTIATAVEVGADGLHLTFSNAVRLLLPGQANKLVGFVRNGDFTQIGTACTADDQATVDTQLSADGDCYINAGSDMAIWTKHFTTFVAYSNTTSPSGGGSSTSSGSSSGSGGGSTRTSSGSSEGVVQGESTSSNGKTSSTSTETPVANLAQPKTAAKEASGGGLRWYWIVLIALAVIGLGVAGVYRYAEGTDRR